MKLTKCASITKIRIEEEPVDRQRRVDGWKMRQTDRQPRLAPDRITLATCPRLRLAMLLMMMKMKLPPNLIKIPNDLHMEHGPQLNKRSSRQRPLHGAKRVDERSAEMDAVPPGLSVDLSVYLSVSLFVCLAAWAIASYRFALRTASTSDFTAISHADHRPQFCGATTYNTRQQETVV